MTMRWYQSDGTVLEWVKGKTNGMPRRPTIADARELGLYPSVTSIIDTVLYSWGLESWRRDQFMAAAWQAGKEGCEFAPRAFAEHAEAIRTEELAFNNAVHGAIATSGEIDNLDESIRPYVRQAWCTLADLPGIWRVELSRVFKQGYAGTPDAVCRDFVLDWKVRRSVDVNRPRSAVYWENGLQLAAYDRGIGGRRRTLVNVAFDREDASKHVMYIWPEAEADRLRAAWKTIWKYWQLRTGYTPPKPGERNEQDQRAIRQRAA